MMALVLSCLPILLLMLWVFVSMRKHCDPERSCTWLLTVYVGCVGGLCLYKGQGTFLDNLIEMVKIVFEVLQGDSEAFLALTPDGSRLRGLAQGLSILTPVMTAGTVFVLLFRRLPLPVLPPLKCHIFSALDSHAVLLAKSIAEKEEARFIFLRTRREDLSADTLLELRSLRVCCYPYGETQLLRRHLSLRLRPLRFYFLTENSEENFDQMDEFLEQAKNHHLFRFISKREYRELYLLSETSSAPMLIDRLRTAYATLPGTELRLLDRYRAASLHLMKTAPLYEARRDGNVRVLLLGMGQVGRSLYRTMVSMGVVGEHQPDFYLCDQNINRIMDTMEQQYPELGTGLTVKRKKYDAESTHLKNLLKRETFDYIVVALGDDERNLRVTAALYRYYRKQYWSGSQTSLPRICVNLEDETKAKSTRRIYTQRGPKPWEPGITVFGTDEEIFSAEVLLPRGLWLAARKLHAVISNQEPKPDWGEYERRSSIAAVAHGAAHLALLPEQGQPDLSARNCSNLTEEQIIKLRKAEHQRWMNYVRSEGMTLAKEEIWSKYVEKLKKHVDVQGQLSPCLIPFDDLHQLYNDLKANLPAGYFPEDALTFQQRDELVARNADIFYQHWMEKNTTLELRSLPAPNNGP